MEEWFTVFNIFNSGYSKWCNKSRKAAQVQTSGRMCVSMHVRASFQKFKSLYLENESITRVEIWYTKNVVNSLGLWFLLNCMQSFFRFYDVLDFWKKGIFLCGKTLLDLNNRYWWPIVSLLVASNITIRSNTVEYCTLISSIVTIAFSGGLHIATIDEECTVFISLLKIHYEQWRLLRPSILLTTKLNSYTIIIPK